MKIRKYVAEDRQEILKLFWANTPTYFSADEEKDLHYYLDNHAHNFFVITSEDGILGCGGFNFSDDLTVGKISWDILHPDHQGKGLGSMLTKFRIDKMKEYDHVKIISVRTSQLVYKFYEKFGLKLVERVRDYWAPGFDMYRMEMPAIADNEVTIYLHESDQLKK